MKARSHDPPLMPATHWRFLQSFREPVSPDRTEGGHVSLESERVPPYWEKGGGLCGGMASGGGSLGLIACLLLLQAKPCEPRAAASVRPTSGFPSGLSETPRENPSPPTPVRRTKVPHKRPTTRSPFTKFSLGNLVRVVCSKGTLCQGPELELMTP